MGGERETRRNPQRGGGGEREEGKMEGRGTEGERGAEALKQRER